MKWFAVDIKGDRNDREYRLYDIRTGDVFFLYSKDKCESLEEFNEIKEDLKYLTLHHIKDDALSYNKHIKPLLRNIIIDKILS